MRNILKKSVKRSARVGDKGRRFGVECLIYILSLYCCVIKSWRLVDCESLYESVSPINVLQGSKFTLLAMIAHAQIDPCTCLVTSPTEKPCAQPIPYSSFC